MPEAKSDIYWQAQLDAISALKQAKIANYALNDRIEPMKMMRAIAKAWANPDALGLEEQRELLVICEKAITYVVYLRTNGLEPSHKNNRYE